jgi:hypothetical protein
VVAAAAQVHEGVALGRSETAHGAVGDDHRAMQLGDEVAVGPARRGDLGGEAVVTGVGRPEKGMAHREWT